jgi:hypothetical protein
MIACSAAGGPRSIARDAAEGALPPGTVVWLYGKR